MKWRKKNDHQCYFTVFTKNTILTSSFCLPGVYPENREICALFRPLCHKITQFCIIWNEIYVSQMLPNGVMTPYYIQTDIHFFHSFILSFTYSLSLYCIVLYARLTHDSTERIPA